MSVPGDSELMGDEGCWTEIRCRGKLLGRINPRTQVLEIKQRDDLYEVDLRSYLEPEGDWRAQGPSKFNSSGGRVRHRKVHLNGG